MSKTLADFRPEYRCRFHPTEGWHEVGCPHQTWTAEQLQEALNAAKQSNAYLSHCLIHPKDVIKADKLTIDDDLDDYGDQIPDK